MTIPVKPIPAETNPVGVPPGGGLLTEGLLARPPFMERVGDLAPRRIKAEARFRPHLKNKQETSPVIWWRGLAMDLLRWGLTLAGLYERGKHNALDLRLVEKEIVVDTLPERLDGFRILQVSDIHLPARFPRFAEKAAAMLAGVEVDLCVLTGDYRWGYYGSLDHVPVQLGRILAGITSRWGTVACLGNHDILKVGEVLEAARIPVLYNEGAAIVQKDAVLWVCGIDDPHNYGCDRLDLAVRDAPEGAFIVLLSHTPERISKAEKAGVSLYLTGHTHGGQIRLPVLGALSKNASCTREQALGLWRHGKMQGYTTSGLGTTDLPVRYNCPPEAALITLRRG
ncbi:MAG: metallophosphoesterase [Candidatus Hydrogenedentes bacterium]|mgnify:CR=1 FL=1|nr:metallophosphoesterase [Candidatus Hydrogenedentota bacterium]